jgi:hypothetical protein
LSAVDDILRHEGDNPTIAELEAEFEKYKTTKKNVRITKKKS